MLTVMLFTPALIFTSSKCSDYRWVTTRFLDSTKTKKSVLKSWVYLKFTDILDSTTEEFKATLKVSKVRFGSFEKRVSSRFFLSLFKKYEYFLLDKQCVGALVRDLKSNFWLIWTNPIGFHHDSIGDCTLIGQKG